MTINFLRFRIVQLIRSEINDDIKELTNSKEGLDTIVSLIKPWIGWKVKGSRESLSDFVKNTIKREFNFDKSF